MGKIKSMEEYWEAWEREKKGEGWLFYHPENAQAEFLSKVEYERITSDLPDHVKAQDKMSPGERALAIPAYPVHIVEKQLKDPFWKTLKEQSVDLYVMLVFSIFSGMSKYGELQGMAENIEHELNSHSLSWGNLKALQHIDADLITTAKVLDLKAKGREKLIQQIKKKHEEYAEFVASKDCLLSSGLKDQILKEFGEFDKWLEQYKKKSVAALEEAADDALMELAGEKKKILKQDVTPRPRRSSAFNTLILPLVDELMSAGFSKKKSCEITDRILKVLYPLYWPDVDENSYHRVRQRYEYWSKKKKR